jgi:hypothetical protein
MKLFITNKDYFEEQFDAPERFENSNREPLTSSQIHKKAFTILSKSLDINKSIPLMINTPYDLGDGLTIFDFISKNKDIYYYEFNGTAS